MDNQVSSVVKLLILSAALSMLIKYVAPNWPIPATAANALVLVLSPSIIMAMALLWRSQVQKQN